MTNYHVATRDNTPRLHAPEGSLYLTGWPSSIMLLLHLTSPSCLFFSFSFTFAPCSFGYAYWYFSLIASSEPCSSPLTWRLFTTSSRLSRPCENLPPKTNHSSSPFPFAHSTTNPFHEGITRGLCHRLHIFRVLWTPPQQKKVDCNAVVPASCININACLFPPPWQSACQSTPHLDGLATHNANALLPLIHCVLANTRMHQSQAIFCIGYYFPERDVSVKDVAGYINTLVIFLNFFFEILYW